MFFIDEPEVELKNKTEILKELKIQYYDIVFGDSIFNDVVESLNVESQDQIDKIRNICRYSRENSSEIMLQGNVNKVVRMMMDKYTTFQKLQKKYLLGIVNENLHQLWLHYRSRILPYLSELDDEIGYLSSLLEMQSKLEDDQENLYDFELEKDLELPFNTNLYAIALFYIYSDKEINKTNCKEIARLYGWGSGVKLRSNYNEWRNPNHRYAHNKFITYYNDVFGYLSPKGKEAANIDLEKFNIEKKKTSFILVAN